MAQPVIRQDTTPTASTRLHGRLGAPAITLTVIACAAPLSVIAGNIPLSVAFGNGLGTPANFAITSVIMLLFAVALAAMSKHVRNAGAFYAYVGRGLGPSWGMAAAGISWLMYSVIQVGVYAYFGLQLEQVTRRVGGPDIAWWAFSLGMIAIVAMLGYRHIELSAKVLGIACCLEFLTVTILDIAIISQGGDHGLNLAGFSPSVFASSIPLFALGIMFCANGFLGFEATAVFRDEVKNPDVTIPRATFAAVLIIGLFYTASAWAMTQGWGSEMYRVAAKGSPFMLDLGVRYVGPIFADVINVLLLGSFFACVLSLHNVISRYQFTLSHSDVLPPSLGRVHAKHGSPHRSSLVQTTTAALLITLTAVLHLDPNAQVFAWASGISTLGFFIALFLTCLSTIVYFARHPELDVGMFRARIAPGLAVLGLAALLVLTVVNFQALTGGSVVVSAVLMGAVLLMGVFGAAISLFFRITGDPRYFGIVKLTQDDGAPTAKDEDASVPAARSGGIDV